MNRGRRREQRGLERPLRAGLLDIGPSHPGGEDSDRQKQVDQRGVLTLLQYAVR